ncbi:Co-chaperone Hsc20 [Aaosphaeria arxii CBS 175.79]|uniref:Co-chaperone Hsc20 n=1 Tax=Aaosphaeria arxii CBS 175.79 TaxID=1450172 RepID=A0A6A5XA28_9PLEO|nr:Co-chaperone Hsc20 [Aaosphaeria arxii CBS 175.79]KAF2009802.1 Co-chaperone Hsc20 [Aaosphaeria arxii CBS 175.79]
MRPIPPFITPRLLSSIPSGRSTTTFRTRQGPCLLCIHRISTRSSPRLQQSTTTSNTTKEDTRAAPQTHYTFFPKSLPAGPPPQGDFSIDLSALKREFLQLQARAHPDLHPPADKSKAQALSARINEAYKTLSSPLSRAQYLLTLRGIEVAEDETAKVEDPELLMEVLETNERIEEAESEDDLVVLKNENEAKVRRSLQILEEAFREDDVDAAKREAVNLRYWANIGESLHAWEKGKPVQLIH